MPDWFDALGRLRDELAVHARAARDVVAGRLGDEAPLEVVPYRGYGDAEQLFAHGRVLRAARLSAAAREDSPWRNLVNMYRRVESDPVPGALVRVRCAGATSHVVCDDEGFFSTWLRRAEPLTAQADWHTAELELLAPLPPAVAAPQAAAQLRVPGAGVRFGVISDVDDTVLQSHVTSFVQAARVALLGNARTRLPFPGVAAFYRGLELGQGGGAPGTRNPIFYVSSSPWNLYDVIAEFLEVQRIPSGPLLLRDWDLSLASLGSGGHHDHKQARIRELFARYPSLPFILVGDSGQQDPEIYSAAVREHPGRVLAVYIRDVTRDPLRRSAMERLAEEVARDRSALVIADDTVSAARHAAEQGWITADAVEEVARDASADVGAAPGKVDVAS